MKYVGKHHCRDDPALDGIRGFGNSSPYRKRYRNMPAEGRPGHIPEHLCPERLAETMLNYHVRRFMVLTNFAITW